MFPSGPISIISNQGELRNENLIVKIENNQCGNVTVFQLYLYSTTFFNLLSHFAGSNDCVSIGYDS